MTSYRQQYSVQKALAKERGVDFLLTYEEWLQIWEDSGHLHERGRCLGQYCMARFGDQGPYVVGNVKIILMTENSSEKVFSETSLQKISVARKRYLSNLSVHEKHLLALKNKRIHSAERREKQSVAMASYHARKKATNLRAV